MNPVYPEKMQEMYVLLLMHLSIYIDTKNGQNILFLKKKKKAGAILVVNNLTEIMPVITCFSLLFFFFFKSQITNHIHILSYF